MRMITEVVVPAGGIRTRITVPRRRPAGCSGDKRQVKEPNTKVWPTGVITLLRMDARITPQPWCCYCRLVKPFMQRFSALTGYSRTCLHSPCIEKRLAVTPAVRSRGMALLYSRIPSLLFSALHFLSLGFVYPRERRLSKSWLRTKQLAMSRRALKLRLRVHLPHLLHLMSVLWK